MNKNSHVWTPLPAPSLLSPTQSCLLGLMMDLFLSIPEPGIKGI